MKKCEYLIYPIPSRASSVVLNEMGAKGWELVQIMYNDHNNINDYYFKREIIDA